MDPNLPITHIILDLDGLLIDSETLFDAAINEILKPFNKTMNFEVKENCLGKKLSETIAIIIKMLNVPLDEADFISRYQDIKHRVLKDIQLKEGANKLINYFWKNEIPMAIATGSSDDSYALKTKNHNDLFSKIHHKVCSGSDKLVKKTKPAPDIFIEAAKRFLSNLPLSPRQVLVFEDAANGVTAGLAANMKVVWVPDSRVNTSTFKNHPDVLILKSLERFSPLKYGLPESSEFIQ